MAEFGQFYSILGSKTTVFHPRGGATKSKLKPDLLNAVDKSIPVDLLETAVVKSMAKSIYNKNDATVINGLSNYPGESLVVGRVFGMIKIENGENVVDLSRPMVVCDSRNYPIVYSLSMSELATRPPPEFPTNRRRRIGLGSGLESDSDDDSSSSEDESRALLRKRKTKDEEGCCKPCPPCSACCRRRPAPTKKKKRPKTANLNRKMLTSAFSFDHAPLVTGDPKSQPPLCKMLAFPTPDREVGGFLYENLAGAQTGERVKTGVFKTLENKSLLLGVLAWLAYEKDTQFSDPGV